MAQKPKLDIKRLDYFPGAYESYYNDNFLFRAQFVSLMSYITQEIFDKANVKKNYLIGDDYWVFEMKKDLPLYLGEKDFSEEQLKKLKKEFKKRQEYFEQRGIKMYILICPSKYSVYPEKLPYFLKIKRRTRTDKFIETIQKNTSVKVIDGRKSLNSRKTNHTLYLKFDTHWNHLGAFFTISDLMDSIRNDYSEVPNFQLSDFEVDTVKVTRGNLKYVLSNADELFEFDYDIKMKSADISLCEGFKHKKSDNFPYSQTAFYQRFCTVKGFNTLKAIVFRDSYANSSIKILPVYFKETVYIWDDWKYMFNKEIVEIEDPDVVIYFVYEGFLDRILWKPTFVEAEKIDKELQ